MIGARTLKKAGLAAAVVLGLLGLGEIVARIAADDFEAGAHFGSPQIVAGRFDSHLGWANRAGSKSYLTNEAFQYRVTIDDNGHRSARASAEVDEDLPLVLILGDSVGWGWGVNDEECFAALLQRDLAGRARVVNASVPGYSTDQELLVLDEFLRERVPDLVILGFVLNDVPGNGRRKAFGLAKPAAEFADGALVWANQPVPDSKGGWKRAVRYRYARLCSHSALLQLVTGTRRGALTSSWWGSAAEPALGASPLERKSCDEIRDPSSTTYRLLAELHARAQTGGFPLVVASLPHLHDPYLLRPEVPRPDPVDPGPFRSQVSRALDDTGRVIGFEAISVDAALLQASSDGAILDCGDGHYNAEGNRIVARELLPVIERVLQP